MSPGPVGALLALCCLLACLLDAASPLAPPLAPALSTSLSSSFGIPLFGPRPMFWDSLPFMSKHKKNITIGYLTAVRGELIDRQGLAVSGALSMALEEVRWLSFHWDQGAYSSEAVIFFLCFQINNDPYLLPGVHLNLRWNDTRGDTVITTRCIVDMLCDGVSAFIGPEGSCHVEAIVAQSRNIPMISYVSDRLIVPQYSTIFHNSIQK